MQMDLNLFNKLNEIYKPLCERADIISKDFLELGYTIQKGFFNNHSIKSDGSFVTEYFPIPVITVNGVGDIGIDLESVWFEVVLPKEKAIALDYDSIIKSYKIEVYGCQNYLKDVFNEQITISDIIPGIIDSSEVEFCILFYLKQCITAGDIIEIIRMLTL